MKVYIRNILFLIGAVLLTTNCNAADGKDEYVRSLALILSYINTVLVITSLISLFQFFFPGDIPRTNFQIFNLAFFVIFYIISILFVLSHKSYYEGFEGMSNIACLAKFFFSFDYTLILQIIIFSAAVVNIIYIRRETYMFE